MPTERRTSSSGYTHRCSTGFHRLCAAVTERSCATRTLEVLPDAPSSRGADMAKPGSRSAARFEPPVVGTLWTLQRREHTARCALLAWPDGWEVRVLVDGETMVSERCTRSHEAFTLAETWKTRLTGQLWQQIIPAHPLGPSPRPA